MILFILLSHEELSYSTLLALPVPRDFTRSSKPRKENSSLQPRNISFRVQYTSGANLKLMIRQLIPQKHKQLHSPTAASMHLNQQTLLLWVCLLKTEVRVSWYVFSIPKFLSLVEQCRSLKFWLTTI